jgi:hypothetical protein
VQAIERHASRPSRMRRTTRAGRTPSSILSGRRSGWRVLTLAPTRWRTCSRTLRSPAT